MHELIFYHQVRVDGGIRTGIEWDGATVFGRFEDGDPEYDPTLLWYVELRCEGPGLPNDAERSRDWLLAQSDVIRDGLRCCALELRAGADPDIYPLIWRGFSDCPGGVEMSLAYSAIRRADAIRMGDVLIDLANHWEDRIRELHSAQTVVN